jgi:hypothetical protein
VHDFFAISGKLSSLISMRYQSSVRGTYGTERRRRLLLEHPMAGGRPTPFENPFQRVVNMTNSNQQLKIPAAAQLQVCKP